MNMQELLDALELEKVYEFERQPVITRTLWIKACDKMGVYLDYDQFVHTYGDEVGPNQWGRVSKRIKRMLKDLGIPTPTDNDLSAACEIIASNSNSGVYYLRFTRDFFWDDGDFGDGDSCYWGMYSGSRPALTNYGAVALQWFEKRSGYGSIVETASGYPIPPGLRPLGRSFIIPDMDVYECAADGDVLDDSVVFMHHPVTLINGYGKLNGRFMGARIQSTMLAEFLQTLDITVHPTASAFRIPGVYVNYREQSHEDADDFPQGYALCKRRPGKISAPKLRTPKAPVVPQSLWYMTDETYRRVWWCEGSLTLNHDNTGFRVSQTNSKQVYMVRELGEWNIGPMASTVVITAGSYWRVHLSPNSRDDIMSAVNNNGTKYAVCQCPDHMVETDRLDPDELHNSVFLVEREGTLIYNGMLYCGGCAERNHIVALSSPRANGDTGAHEDDVIVVMRHKPDTSLYRTLPWKVIAHNTHRDDMVIADDMRECRCGNYYQSQRLDVCPRCANGLVQTIRDGFENMGNRWDAPTLYTIIGGAVVPIAFELDDSIDRSGWRYPEHWDYFIERGQTSHMQVRWCPGGIT